MLHFLENGDTVWGSGIRGLHESEIKIKQNVKFEAVRSPLTREKLLSTGNYDIPEIYGDSGLLAPLVYPKSSLETECKDKKIALLPNLNELQKWADYAKDLGSKYKLISPTNHPKEVIKEIINSEAIITSSLHGFIMAETYQVPRSLVTSTVEPRFKYDDYYEGTGRASLKIHKDIKSAEDSIDDSTLNFNKNILLESFPSYLWR
ncbi:polysaccharide pyruvyl transferase family protein [Rothia nasimurium]|uniref:polysaccharide pyruvyl transferase family protein n=1 Tax=Rothia nasimurium TaxID=85336 RepID=UPI0030153538